MKIKSITIIGRRWFHRGPGNTYHSATVLVNGEVKARVAFCYGYDSQYQYTGMEALSKAGILKDWDQQKSSPWSYCDKRGIAFHAEASDVQCKKDL